MKKLQLLKHTSQDWVCTCGQVIPKKGTHLSDSLDSHHGLHIHCPNCNKIAASFINPKETK